MLKQNYLPKKINVFLKLNLEKKDQPQKFKHTKIMNRCSFNQIIKKNSLHNYKEKANKFIKA